MDTLLSPSKPGQICHICERNATKYTCPRCRTKTCSASCSNRHKELTACSGVRDRAAYVPMNSYSWGTMMDDYVFLEDVGRVVEDHGAKIGRGRYVRARGNATRGRRGGMHAAAAASGRGSKKDVLEMQLSFKNISVDFLPEGMQRGKLNQSRWDPKENSVYLTVGFVFHSPASSGNNESSTMITHRNDLKTPIHILLSRHVQTAIERTKKNAQTSNSQLQAPPSWIADLLPSLDSIPKSNSHSIASSSPPSSPSHDHSNQHPLFFLPEYPPRPRIRGSSVSSNPYHRIDPSETLQKALDGKAFLEFPTFEIMNGSTPQISELIIVGENDEDESFSEEIIKKRGFENGLTPRTKRQKMDPPVKSFATKAKAITGLIGAYGSDDEDGEDRGKDVDNGVVNILGGYDSDGDVAPPEDEASDDGESGNDEDKDVETDIMGDGADHLPNALEVAGVVGADATLQGVRHPSSGYEDVEDELDWGDDDDF